MPLMKDEGSDWNETEKELDRALCSFCNSSGDPWEVSKWNDEVWKARGALCKAYNNWYSWQLNKSKEIKNEEG